MITWKDLTSAQKNMLAHDRVMDLPASDAEVPAYTESMDTAWQVLQRMQESCIMVFSVGREDFASDLFLGEISTRGLSLLTDGEWAGYFTLKDLASLTPLKICETALKVLCDDIDFGEKRQ